MQFRRLSTHFTGFSGVAAKWLKPDPDNYLPQVNFDEPEGVMLPTFRRVRAEDGLALLVGDFVERKAGRTKRAMLVFAAEDPYGESPTERVVRFASACEVRAVGPHGDVPVKRMGDGSSAVCVRSSECVFVISR